MTARSAGEPSAVFPREATGQTRVSARRFQRGAKRLVDLTLGAVTTLLFLPLMALVAVLILIRDGRPIFFRQERVGLDGKPFTMLKFRSMVRDAEGLLPRLREMNERQGPLFKLTHDPRVTGLGRFLRGSSIDELPQLLNVLRGHMSLVGPRPALPAEVESFDDDLKRRATVKPGITGLWQIRARDDASFESYRRFDLTYVETWTVGMDLWILLRTAPAVLGRTRKDRLTDSTPVGLPDVNVGTTDVAVAGIGPR